MNATPESRLPEGITLRPATHDDYDDVVAFTTDTWGEDSDYIPRVYHDWLEGERKRTLVADAGDAIAGIAQAVMLSSYEGWAQGMRVNPDFRGQGIGMAITYALFRWAREQGATVVRNMVFSWNQAGLGQSRAVGFDPVTEFRWLQPDPTGEMPETVRTDVDAAWAFWTASNARNHLRGLVLDMDETWAMRDLTREMLTRAADETALLTVVADKTEGFAYRVRTFDRENDAGESERWAEYGVGAWATLESAETLLSGIAADAAACGANRTRVLIPETARTVSDGAYLRANPSEEPDFVLAADVSGY